MYAIVHMAKTLNQARQCRARDGWQQTQRGEKRSFDTLPFNAYSRRFH